MFWDYQIKRYKQYCNDLIKYSLDPPRAGFLLNQCYNSSISSYPMSEEQLKAFIEKVKGDTSLQEKLKAAADADAVAAIAKEAGFSISADDLAKAKSELSEEELEGVAGGTLILAVPFIIGEIEKASNT